MRIKGNTDLTGAVITSTAEAQKNNLTTGTLTYSDIENQSHYSANSNGISAGAGVGTTGKATGPGSVSGSGGAIPMALNESGDQSATTRSAVSAGTITITDQANQTQDVAGLSRDTTNTNGTVSNTPDVQNLLNQQADTMAAAQAAGQVIAQGIAAYANDKQETAQKAADAAKASGDMDAYTKYQAEADSWAEGGTNRTELHIAGGALLGGLGGGGIGSAAAGAAGAGVSSALAGKLNGLADQIGDATGSMTLGNVVSNVLAGAGGALVGGGMGAFTASNADLYNRSTGNAEGTGGTGSDFLDRLGEAIKNTVDDPLGALNHALNSLLPAPGPQPDADPNPLVQANDNGKPPATGGAVVTPPVVVCTPAGCVVAPGVATPGTQGYVPGNATLNSGNNDEANGGNGDNSTFWSSTKDKTPVENAYDHSTKHGAEFPDYQNSVQYVQATQDFVNNPPEGTLIKTRPNGDTLYYDPATNTFAVKNQDGAPKTMFKPAAGMDYWNKQ